MTDIPGVSEPVTAPADATSPAAWEFRRWRRFGHDRLYVARADGTAVGHRDLVADIGSPETDESEEELRAAVTSWRADQDSAQPDPVSTIAEPVEDADAAAPVLAEAAPTDLADVRAGAAARAQARAAKEAAPVRTVLARLLRVHNDERAWRIGADGEEMVAARLAKLAGKDPRWKFLHAVPVGERGSDIDHVVVGPGGVFTLNAKHHPKAKIWIGGDTIMVNGQRVPYVRNSRHEASRAARLLTAACGWPVEVRGVVVPVNASEITVKAAAQDVVVVPRMQLHRWLRKQEVVLSDDQVEQVYAAARCSTTWQPAR